MGPLYMCGTEHPNVSCHRIASTEVGSGRHLDHHFMVESGVREIVTPQAFNKMFELDFSERTEDKEEEYSREDTKFLVREFVTQKIITMRFPFLSALTANGFPRIESNSFKEHYG